jgi:predicted XRE-type DNA-binding protein
MSNSTVDKNLKAYLINVSHLNKEGRVNIQKKAFQLGYEWANNKQNLNRYFDCDLLCLNSSGIMSQSIMQYIANYNYLTGISVSDFMELTLIEKIKHDCNPADNLELSVKSTLIIKINDKFNECAYSCQMAAKKLGVPEQVISDLKNLQHDRFSIEILIKFIADLGLTIKIS